MSYMLLKSMWHMVEELLVALGDMTLCLILTRLLTLAGSL